MTEEAKEPEEEKTEGEEQAEVTIETHKKFNQQLPCKLTDKEILDAADKMAEAERQLTETEESLKTVKAQFKAQTEQAQAEVARYANLIRSKTEFRMIECEKFMNYEAGVITETRLDTGEKLGEREMTEAEKQVQMKLA